MKSLLARLIGPVAALALFTTAQGASYVTDFNPPAFAGNRTLSGQGSWDTNNYLPSLGQSDFVGVLSGYSLTISDYWGLLGGAVGIAPVVNTSFLYRPVVSSGATSAAFSVKFGIISSQIPRGNKDTFGWTFRDSSGVQLLRVSFIPATSQSNNLTVRIYDASNNQLLGSGLYNIFYDAKYDLSLSLSSTGVVSMSLKDSLGITTPIVNSQIATGAIPHSISDVAATWTLFDTTANPNGTRPNFGSNALVFDSYSLTFVIPDPPQNVSIVRDAGGAIHPTWRGTPGATYRVDVSSDLLTWTPAATRTAAAVTGLFDFPETLAPTVTSRFYRAVRP